MKPVIMKKIPILIHGIICVSCFFSLLWGCDNQKEQPPKSREVTQKIITEKEASKPEKGKKIDISKSVSKKEMVTYKPPVVPGTSTAKTAVSNEKKIDVSKSVPKKETVINKPPAASGTSTAKTAVSNEKKVVSISRTQLIEIPEGADLYNPEGKLDPFAPLFQKERVAVMIKKKSKKTKPLTPLEKIDLSQLKLVGIIQADSGNRACVQEVSGKGYVVKKGMYIGTHSGRIVQILKDRIVVEEEVEDIYGNIVLEKKPLKLQKPPGE